MSPAQHAAAPLKNDLCAGSQFLLNLLILRTPTLVLDGRFRFEHREWWPEIASGFTHATRNEAGCLWFDWSRSIDEPTEYVLVEAFRDEAAGAAHVLSEMAERTSG